MKARAANGALSSAFLSTASPFKFAPAVMDAIKGAGYSNGRSNETIINELSEESGLAIPATLADIAKREVRHTMKIEKDEMKNTVKDILVK